MLFAALVLIAGAPSVHAADPAEYDVKAAFLFNFAKFVDWPDTAFADAKSPFIIGVLGDDPFGTALGKILAGKTVKNHPLTAKRIAHLEEIKTVHLLFICRSEKEQVGDILNVVNNDPVLTITDFDTPAAHAADIVFDVCRERVVFDVNTEAARRARLRISSKLLRVARSVR